MTRKKIVALCGSTRYNSTNESILTIIASLYNDSLDVQLYKGIGELPHFNPDDDGEQVPVSIKNFRDLIAAADGVIICTPEYVFSLPGALKNAIEWTVSTTVFSDKPLAIIVASGLGEKTFESLTLIMNTVGAKIGPHAKLLIQGARSKVNPEGQLTDEAALQDIKTLMTSFIETLN